MFFFVLLTLSLTILLLLFLYTQSSYSIHYLDIKPRISYNNDSIPLYNYGNYGIQINPLFVAVEVLHHYKGETPQDIEIALNNANWLVENGVSMGNYTLFVYDFPVQVYNFGPPWTSAMAQARAALALERANNLTSDARYLDEAEKYLNSLFVDVQEGGVTYKSADQGWWFEEYAFINSTTLKPRVLNGMMAILNDLYKYYENTKDSKALFLFDRGIDALKHNIHRYDFSVPTLREYYENTNDIEALGHLVTGLLEIKNNTHRYFVDVSTLEGYTFYDAIGTLPGENYHNYHLTLLSHLMNITNEKAFSEYYDKWQSYSGPYIKAKLMTHSDVSRPTDNGTKIDLTYSNNSSTLPTEK